MSTKYSKYNSFEVTADLLNSENLKTAIAQLCHELHDIVCIFTMIYLTKIKRITYKTKYCKCNSFQVTTHLLNSENLKVAIVQLCNELQVCNFSVIADQKLKE